MTMDKSTIDQLNAQAGRDLSADELAGLQERTEQAARDLRAMMPTRWASMSVDEKTAAIAQLAQARYMDKLIADQGKLIEDIAKRRRSA